MIGGSRIRTNSSTVARSSSRISRIYDNLAGRSVDVTCYKGYSNRVGAAAATAATRRARCRVDDSGGRACPRGTWHARDGRVSSTHMIDFTALEIRARAHPPRGAPRGRKCFRISDLPTAAICGRPAHESLLRAAAAAYSESLYLFTDWRARRGRMRVSRGRGEIERTYDTMPHAYTGTVAVARRARPTCSYRAPSPRPRSHRPAAWRAGAWRLRAGCCPNCMASAMIQLPVKT